MNPAFGWWDLDDNTCPSYIPMRARLSRAFRIAWGETWRDLRTLARSTHVAPPRDLSRGLDWAKGTLVEGPRWERLRDMEVRARVIQRRIERIETEILEDARVERIRAMRRPEIQSRGLETRSYRRSRGSACEFDLGRWHKTILAYSNMEAHVRCRPGRKSAVAAILEHHRNGFCAWIDGRRLGMPELDWVSSPETFPLFEDALKEVDTRLMGAGLRLEGERSVS